LPAGRVRRRFPSDVKTYPLEFVLVPFLLWAAFRFGRREMAILMVVLSAIVIWGTLRNYGPFARPTWEESMILVQAYICVMAITGIVLAAVVAEHKHAEIKLREMASTDPLTGLVNYRRLLDVLRTEIARSSRTHRPFTIVFVDMNGLKKVNDKYGHLVGSRALCRIADAAAPFLPRPRHAGAVWRRRVRRRLPETLEEGGPGRAATDLRSAGCRSRQARALGQRRARRVPTRRRHADTRCSERLTRPCTKPRRDQRKALPSPEKERGTLRRERLFSVHGRSPIEPSAMAIHRAIVRSSQGLQLNQPALNTSTLEAQHSVRPSCPIRPMPCLPLPDHPIGDRP
jgi:hypothetical protein